MSLIIQSQRMINEEQIIKGCIKHSKSEQKILYEKFSPEMRGVCFRYARNYEDAEDILHEGFIKVFKHIKQYHFKGSLEGWIRRIMVNTAISYYRKASKYVTGQIFDSEVYIENTEDDDIRDLVINPDDIKVTIQNARLSQDDILNAVKQLPDGYRMVFNLYAIENYKHKEIAEILNIDINTSKSQLARARKYMQKQLYEIAVKKVKEARRQF